MNMDNFVWMVARVRMLEVFNEMTDVSVTPPQQSVFLELAAIFPGDVSGVMLSLTATLSWSVCCPGPGW